MSNPSWRAGGRSSRPWASRSTETSACEGGAGVAFDAAIDARRRNARSDFARGHRLAEPEALHEMDACGAQEQVLLRGLHALGRDLHAEPPAEAHHRMHDGRGVGGLLDREHKALVDLELVNMDAAQIQQARIARAKVVERKLDAQRLEPPHRIFRIVEIAEQRAFGELEFQPRRFESGFQKRSLDRADEIKPAELQRGNVDRDYNSGP